MKFLLKPWPANANFKDLRDALAKKLCIPSSSIHIKKTHKEAVVSFSNEPSEDFESKLAGLHFHGRPLHFHLMSMERCLADQVTPLWKFSYEQQLEVKQDAIKALLEESFSPSADFNFEPIIASPLIHGYRNKVEFSIGFDASGKKLTVGFIQGMDGRRMIVADPSQCLHVSDHAKVIAKTFEAFIEESSKLDPRLVPFDSEGGFWRILLVRIHNDTPMIAVQVQAGRIEQELSERLKQQLALLFPPPTSLWWQESSARHHGLDRDFSLISGGEFLSETLLDRTFRISPASFFQVNKPACELLYGQIRDYALTLHPKSTSASKVLLDLCCGTGTIGIALAPFFDRVIGIECVAEAVADARLNADLNGLCAKTEWHADLLERALPGIIASLPADANVTVVLDPPRAGAHKSVIKCIRECARIDRCVYVSCAPELASSNWIALCSERGFKLTAARPVDMFPHTLHTEAVLLFERTRP